MFFFRVFRLKNLLKPRQSDWIRHQSRSVCSVWTQSVDRCKEWTAAPSLRAHLASLCGRGETAALACTTVLHTLEQTLTRRIGGTHAQLCSSLFVGVTVQAPQYSLARGIIQCLIDLHLWQLRSFLYLSFVRTGRSKT